MKSPPNSAKIPGREPPEATFPSPDDKEDDGGALAGTGRRPDYRAAHGVAIIVETGVST